MNKESNGDLVRSILSENPIMTLPVGELQGREDFLKVNYLM